MKNRKAKESSRIYCGRVIKKSEDNFNNKLAEQRKNLDPNKKYIIDPFVGYIEKN